MVQSAVEMLCTPATPERSDQLVLPPPEAATFAARADESAARLIVTVEPVVKPVTVP